MTTLGDLVRFDGKLRQSGHPGVGMPPLNIENDAAKSV
jgi:hypothetical protein